MNLTRISPILLTAAAMPTQDAQGELIGVAE